MAASTVIAGARRSAGVLLAEMHSLDSHYIGHLVNNSFTIATGELMRPINAAALPVSPVQIITQQAETK